jgi:transcriptional regulator with XRE-family HTH domain
MPRRASANPLAAAVGGRVRAFREARGSKLEEVAFHSELRSKGHLSDLEHGRLMPNVKSLAALARYFGVDLLDLVTFPEQSARQRLVAATRALPADWIARWLSEIEDRVEAAPQSAPAVRVVHGRRPRDAVPFVDLRAAAGVLGEERSVEATAWVKLDRASAELPGAFVARVFGTSMEPRVPDGAFALFRRPGPGSRRGRVFLVQRGEVLDDGGAYQLKLVETGRRRGREVIVLRSLHPAVPPMVVAREELRVVAELVRVLSVEPGASAG